jgi:hypothetical protein
MTTQSCSLSKGRVWVAWIAQLVPFHTSASVAVVAEPPACASCYSAKWHYRQSQSSHDRQ